MFARPLRLWRELREQLWFKPAWWGVVATIVALAAALANQLVADDVLPDVERATLQGLLTIIASSMLTVSTFSLSILVQAFSSAAGNATPRALRVIMADDNAQTAIAAFIAAFIYAVIALLALGLGYYGPTGRFVLLVFTILVMVQVIVMLIRWIRTLSRLGRLGHTLERVEAAASESLHAHWRAPALGGQSGPAPAQGQPLRAAATGYVHHLDMAALQAGAEALQLRVHLLVRPGAFVVRGQVLALLVDARGAAARVAPERTESLGAAIEVGTDRSFDQDPRFGLLVLSEIGQRALSAAVNDPGSAILVAGAITRVLVDTWPGARPPAQPASPACDRVFVPALDDADLVRDGFAPLQRDAGGLVEVHTRFTKLLQAIAEATGGAVADEARRLAWRGWLLAREKIVLDDERAALERLARGAARAGSAVR